MQRDATGFMVKADRAQVGTLREHSKSPRVALSVIAQLGHLVFYSLYGTLFLFCRETLMKSPSPVILNVTAMMAS